MKEGGREGRRERRREGVRRKQRGGREVGNSDDQKLARNISM